MKKELYKNKEKGFALVEMLVSIALFSIVLVVILGSIITIIDVNRKSQSLTVAMNDINFTIESLNRSIKTGRIDSGRLATQRSSAPPQTNRETTNLTIINQDGHRVTYSLEEDNGRGYVQRSLQRLRPDGTGEGSAENVPITSNQIDITNLTFTTIYGSSNRQPRVLLLLEGVVQTSPTISSEFSIQTTVSQRNLDQHYLFN